MRVYRSRFEGSYWRGASVLIGVMVAVAACTRTSDDTVADTTLPPTEPTTTTEPPILFGPGVDEGLIHVGAVLPLSGPRASLGQSVLAGHEAYWTYVNQELGGVDGFEVEVVSADSQYQPDVAEAAAARLAEETLTITAVLGSPITDAIRPVATQEGLLVAAGAQISDWGPDQALLLNLAFPAYRDQVRVGVEWATASGQAAEGAVAAIISQEGVYGDDCVEGFRRGVGTALTEGLELEHDLAQTDFTDLVATARDGGAELLVVCSVPDALLAIVATAELLEYQPLVVATGVSYDSGIPAALGGDAGEEAGLQQLEKLFVMGALEEGSDTSPGLRLYDDNLARVGLESRQESWYTFLGYTQAATMHVVLAEAFGARDVTREGLRAAVGNLTPVDFGFGAGPMAFDETGVPFPVDAPGAPVAAGKSVFGLERVADFLRLDE